MMAYATMPYERIWLKTSDDEKIYSIVKTYDFAFAARYIVIERIRFSDKAPVELCRFNEGATSEELFKIIECAVLLRGDKITELTIR